MGAVLSVGEQDAAPKIENQYVAAILWWTTTNRLMCGKPCTSVADLLIG